jgi:iron complex outermembrane receptor protein
MLHQTRFKKHAIGAAVAAALAGGALAQTAPDEESGKVQEVIVTAQRIAQPASKTPVSLSVLSGEDLKAAGAFDATRLTELVPNVQISNNTGATVITIRGVSSADVTEKGDPSASFNIDGVNFARPQSAGIAFYDLERIEVLRGPQGTLYGRNSTAGAINLITNKPQPRFESSASAELGNYNSVRLEGMVNGKVNDLLSVRAAVARSKHDGYLRSTQNFSTNYDDDDTRSGRLQAMFRFNPDWSLLLSTDASTNKGSGGGSVLYDTYLTKRGAAQRTATPSIQGFNDNRSRGASAELKAKVGIGELTYQLAVRDFDINIDLPFGQEVPDVAQTHFRIISSFAQRSHELRLASGFGQWKTIGGLYWFREHSAVDARIKNFPQLGELSFIQNPTISASKALFGEATYSATEDLHLTAGVRRTKDDKSRKGITSFGDPVFYTSLNDAAVNYAQTTGKLGADYMLAKNTMLYATLSTGYKAGGFNDGTVQTNRFLKYAPEHLTALEVGIKGRTRDGRLQVNADVFAYNYKDLQLSGVAVDPVTGALSSQTLNAAKASVKGLEIEGKYAVSNVGRINFSATYLDAHFKEYKPNATTNWAGKSLAKSPKASAGIAYTHRWNLDNGGMLSASAGTRYSASYVLNDYDNANQIKQRAYRQSDMHASYSSPSDKWSLEAYVRNIEDNTIMTNYGGPPGPRATANLAPPRTVGVRLGANF